MTMAGRLPELWDGNYRRQCSKLGLRQKELPPVYAIPFSAGFFAAEEAGRVMRMTTSPDQRFDIPLYMKDAWLAPKRWRSG